MNFSNIKAITIPEGEVKRIEVNGVVIWELEEVVVLTSITLSGQTTSLNRGASFSFGGTVTAHYSNGTTANVTNSTTFSGYNMSTSGTYTVTASYTENGITKTATYSLTVNKVWSTIFSGTKTMTWSTSGSTPSDVAVLSYSTFTNPSNIRVTFSISSGSTSNNIRYLKLASGDTNGYYTTTKPSSPLQSSSFNPNNNLIYVGVTYNGSGSDGFRMYLKWDKTNKKFLLHAVKSSGIPVSSNSLTLKVTKIERYY